MGTAIHDEIREELKEVAGVIEKLLMKVQEQDKAIMDLQGTIANMAKATMNAPVNMSALSRVPPPGKAPMTAPKQALTSVGARLAAAAPVKQADASDWRASLS